jgi:hypothetical protein
MKILVQSADDRIPLVKIFVHPWVLFFQEKYKIKRERDTSSEETSSDEESSIIDESSESVEEEEIKQPPVRNTAKRPEVKSQPVARELGRPSAQHDDQKVSLKQEMKSTAFQPKAMQDERNEINRPASKMKIKPSVNDSVYKEVGGLLNQRRMQA